MASAVKPSPSAPYGSRARRSCRSSPCPGPGHNRGRRLARARRAFDEHAERRRAAWLFLATAPPPAGRQPQPATWADTSRTTSVPLLGSPFCVTDAHQLRRLAAGRGAGERWCLQAIASSPSASGGCGGVPEWLLRRTCPTTSNLAWTCRDITTSSRASLLVAISTMGYTTSLSGPALARP